MYRTTLYVLFYLRLRSHVGSLITHSSFCSMLALAQRGVLGLIASKKKVKNPTFTLIINIKCFSQLYCLKKYPAQNYLQYLHIYTYANSKVSKNHQTVYQQNSTCNNITFFAPKKTNTLKLWWHTALVDGTQFATLSSSWEDNWLRRWTRFSWLAEWRLLGPCWQPVTALHLTLGE